MAEDTPPPTVRAPDPNPFADPKYPKNLVERVQAVLLKPVPTWDVIDGETATVKSLYTSYILPLAAIGPFANAVGSFAFGYSFMGISFRPSLVTVLSMAILSYVLSLAVIYVVALVIDGLAPSFNGQKNFIQALKVAAYGSTAAWVAAIFGLLPALAWVGGLLGLYSIYLVYLGLPKLMKNPPDKTIVYMIVIAVIYIVLAIIAAAIITPVARGLSLASSGGVSTQTGTVNGTLAVPGVGAVDVGKMEAAANQMAAQASAAQNGQTIIKLADPAGLLALMPQSFQGAAPGDVSTSSGGAAGVAVATAEATYHIGAGTARVSVTDLGTVAGFGAMAAAVNMNSQSSSAGGYEKITTQNGNMVTEKWDNSSKHGEYTVVSGGRITVSAQGDNVDIGTLKSLVASVDVNRAVALTR